MLKNRQRRSIVTSMPMQEQKRKTKTRRITSIVANNYIYFQELIKSILKSQRSISWTTENNKFFYDNKYCIYFVTKLTILVELHFCYEFST